MGDDTKGERGSKPKNLPSDQTLDLPAAAIDDGVSLENVEVIEPPASSYQPGPRRCRHKKRSMNSPNPEELPFSAENIEPPASSPGLRRCRRKKPSEITPKELHTIAASCDTEMAPLDSDAEEEPVNWQSVLNAVVKVFSVHKKPDFFSPWLWKEQYNSSSSGFVISGKRVLTTAHSLEHYTEVKLMKRVSGTKFPAKVLAISIECDIAMLTVDDDEFWDGVSPLEFGDLPALNDAVTVVGYPIRGNTIPVPSGFVSWIEIVSYVHGSTRLLRFQIDPAINFEDSGGPACNGEGNCVGIAFKSQRHQNDKKIGYVIPTPVITHFIHDYEKNGKYTDSQILGVEWQTMENPHLRMAMGMETDQTGVLVKRIDPIAPVSNVLKVSDVILSFDGVDIGNDGDVLLYNGEHIGFTYLVSQKYDGDVVATKVLRDSQIINLNISLESGRRLIPGYGTGKPSYYIVTGFVFTILSAHYLYAKYEKDYENEIRAKLWDRLLQTPDDEQVVVVSQVLAADINRGYRDIITNTQVFAFNGKPVKNLKSLVTMVESCDDEFLSFELEFHQLVVLETMAAKPATLNILATYCIPSAMSDDLKPEE